MKKFKRIIAMMLSVLLLLTSIPATAFTAFAAAADDSNIVLGSNGKITRAEWLHNLVYVFEMVVEEEALPDNYYNDLDESHKYYEDILLAVEFGVVDVEAGGALRPDDAVTREFAASTLNFCLGYQLDEGTEYAFGDYADCLDPDSAQVAVDRNWFALISGNFSPATLVTESEVEFMLDDALEILGKTVVDATYTSTFEFEDDIIVIPDGIDVIEDENGTVHIANCSQTINSGDRFAVYYNGIPSVYTADTVSTENSVTTITTTKVESDDAFVSVDAQGVADAEAMEITPVEGVDVSFEEDNSGISTFSTKKLKSIKAKTELELFPGVTADVSVKIKSPEIEYSVSSSYAYVLLQGDTEISYSIEANLVEMAFGNKAIELFNVSVLGIGNFTVSVEFELSGAASGEVEGYLVAGIECTKGGKLRAIKSFQQKQYSSNVEATASVGLKVTLGITKMPVISAYIYAEAGVKANLKSTTYKDDKEPHKCVHFAAYLYVKYGASASAKFGGWKTSLSVNYDIFNDKNSPVKIVHHYENGVLVPSCTRGTDYSNFFTKASSRWGGSGWISANGAYGLNADGTYFALYNYTLNDKNEATITKYNGNSWSVYIPKEIDGYTVVSIGSQAFKNKSVHYVVVPDTVNTIDVFAFAGCYSLKNINIPETVIDIASYAFWDCVSLESIKIPTSMEVINDNVFNGCSSLRNVVIPNNITAIEANAFNECVSLKDVTLSKGLTSLGWSSFGNTAIAEIEIPKSLTYCGTAGSHTYDFDNKTYYLIYGPFRACDNLKTVTYENGTTEIAEGLLAGCTGIEKLNIPNTVTIIENWAFACCLRLKDVTIGNSVTQIGSNAFSDCVSLVSIKIPDSVTEIGNAAFNECVSLKDVTLSKGLTSLGWSSFGNTAIAEIEIPKSLTYCGTAGSHTYDFDNKTYYLTYGPFRMCDNLKTVTFEKGTTEIAQGLLAGCTGVESISIPNTITIIEDDAFMGCLRLSDITFGDSVTQICDFAFYNCVSLKSIVIPNSVNEINSNAFNECVSLKEVTLSKGLTSLGWSSFGNTAIAEIEIPKSLTYCETASSHSYKFNNKTYYLHYGPFRACDNLKTVTFEKGSTEIAEGLFAGCTGLEKIDIPDTVTSIEQNAFTYCLRLNDVTFGNSVARINNGAFSYCVSLQSVIVPDSVTNMAGYIFSGCSSLGTATLPKEITNIGTSMFRDCVSLKTIELPLAVDTIESNAFYGCTGLEGISIPNGSRLTDIQSSSFYNCVSLKEVVLPNTVKTIGYDAFRNNTALVKIYIPSSVKSIGSSAFMGCELLSDVTIGDYGITTISNSTFKDCPALVSIVLPKGLTTIGSQAFMNDTALVSVTISESVTSIDSTAFSYPTKTTIYGKTGSYAETFANNGGFTFKDNSIPVEGIILKDGVENVTLDVGETYRAEFEVYPEDANDVITLTANNSNVTINGHDIYARYSGDTVITATSTSGLTYQFNVHIRSIKGIEVITNPTKTTYIMGEEFDKTGMVVQVNYYDGSSKIVDDYTISGFDSSAEGTNTVTVKWMSSTSQILTTYSTTFTVNIVDPTPKLTGIFVETLPNKLNFELREKLDTTGLVVKGTYTDNSTKEINDYTVSGYNALKSGSQTITVTYGDYTATFTVSVGAVKTLSAVSVAQAPTKTEYYIGDALTTAGLQLTLAYSDNSTTTVSSGFTTSGFDSASAGTKNITVSYEGVSTTFTVKVKTPSIVISETEKSLLVDEIVTLTATTDPTGQTITWISSNNSVATVSNGVVTAKSEGNAVITARFTYNGINYEKTCTISVTEPEATLTTIDIVSEPSKTIYYIGDNLVTSGLQVKLTYSDSTTDTITTGYSVTGFTSATAGTKTVTVSYGGLTDTFTVTVKTPSITLSSNAETITVGEDVTLSATTLPSGQSVVWTSSSDSIATVNNGTVVAEGAGTAVITAKFTYNGVIYSATCSITVESIPVTLTSISVNTQPSKTVYEIGESLDTTGLVLKLTYSDDSTDTVTSGFTTSGFSSATAGTKTVTVQYGGLTTSFIVTVNAALAPEDAPQLIMGSSETMAGKEVVVTLSVKNNPGIAGLAVSLKYDESVLTLKDTENGGLFSGFTAAKNFAWDESEDVTDDGVLATFVFMVAEDAPAGDYNIEVLVRSCTNENLDDVALLTTNGTISVIDFVYGDSNGDQKIDMKDVVLLRKYITNFDYDTNTSSVNVELGADANGDNKIDMKDVVILRKYITNYDYDTESSTVVLGPQ